MKEQEIDKIQKEIVGNNWNPEQECKLINMANCALLDVELNFDTTENDFWVALLIDHLNETKSKLAKQVTERGAIYRVSYSYQALEEVVVNAFYHRDYLSYQSIMIEIEPVLI